MDELLFLSRYIAEDFIFMLKYSLVLFLYLAGSSWIHSQALCENGFADIYPCSNVDLLAYLDPASIGGGTTNEVWGWTDTLDGTEYVLLGKSSGTAFFDISNPTEPILLGELPTASVNSIWRTLRVRDHYLYVSSEANNHGLQVFDLYHLRDVINPPVAFEEDAHYSGFGKCHSLTIEEETGFLFASGTNTFGGGLHIVNIQNPLIPVLAGGYDQDGYTHESQVIVYNGPDLDYAGRTIAFCFNGNNPANLTIVDVTDPTDASTVSISFYPNSAYGHQGWLTPDREFMLMDDELDEYYSIYSNTRTLIWNMHDLDAPFYMGDHLGPTPAIDHNQMIIGNLSYQSNYTAGFRILDITNIADTSLLEVASFDHFTANNANVFDGEWMSYPYFESGVVPVTDIDGGMFLLSPNFTQVVGNNQAACANDTAHFQLVLSAGFQGPIYFEASGLPLGTNVWFDQQGVSAPDTIDFHITGFGSYSGILAFEVTANGLYNSYSRTVNFEVVTPLLWYLDADGDGWGLLEGTVATCDPDIDYVPSAGDCDDSNSFVYPSAPGTAEGIDNNCDGEVSGFEVNICGDVDGDGVVTVLDLMICTSQQTCTDNCEADINQDGMVTVADLMMVLADFGELCY